MMAVRTRRVVALACVALAMSACSVLPDKKPVTVYQLPNPVSPVTAMPGEPGSSVAASGIAGKALRVNTPVAGPTLNSDRILVSPAQYQVMAYKGVRWHDLAPRIVRNQLALQLRAINVWNVVTTDDTTARASYLLGGELLDFQVQERSGNREVTIRFEATLIDADTNRVVAARPFKVIQPVQGQEFDRVIEAFGQATQQLGAEVAAWLAQAAAR